MKLKLTDRELKRLPAKDKPYDIADTHRDAPPAFGVRVMPNGEMTFHLYRRFPGSPSPVRRALGRFGEISLDDARTKARDWIAQIKLGIDPSGAAKRGTGKSGSTTGLLTHRAPQEHTSLPTATSVPQFGQAIHTFSFFASPFIASCPPCSSTFPKNTTGGKQKLPSSLSS